MSRFVIRPRAERDLEGIEEYISEHGGPRRARTLINAFDRAFRLLARMPQMGRAWESASPHLEGLRAWPLTGYKNYLILYRPLKRGIEVLHVFHTGQDVRTIIEHEEDEDA